MSTAMSIPSSALVWVPASCGEAVENAVQGGETEDGKVLQIVRGATGNGEIAPGKFHEGYQYAHLQFCGKELHKEEYEVLTNVGDVQFTWVAATGGEVPAGAVEGGQCSDGEPIYISRAKESGDVIPGKLVPRCSRSYVSYAGKEIGHGQYEVLCIKTVKVGLREE